MLIFTIRKYSFGVILILLFPNVLISQSFNDFERSNTEARFVFYNTENLFDIYKDSVKRDEDFTPDGAKHWDKWKYSEKQENLSKVIISIGGWDLPELVAFCEIENKKVLYDLTNYTSLKNKGYEIIHFESPDRRGIDVGFIYLKDKIEVLEAEPITINFPWDSNYKTRDILHAKLLLFKTDALHFFVCHWPSKWGGHLETDKSRFLVGSVLKKEIDKTYNENPGAKILVMGDMNDTPFDESLTEGLGAKTDTVNCKRNSLVNLSAAFVNDKTGTHKYQDNWSVIDHVIVNYDLLNPNNSMHVKDRRAYVFKEDYLIEKDPKFFGEKPFRTYVGMRYNGGYSDHLPVFVDFKLR